MLDIIKDELKARERPFTVYFNDKVVNLSVGCG